MALINNVNWPSVLRINRQCQCIFSACVRVGKTAPNRTCSNNKFAWETHSPSILVCTKANKVCFIHICIPLVSCVTNWCPDFFFLLFSLLVKWICPENIFILPFLRSSRNFRWIHLNLKAYKSFITFFTYGNPNKLMNKQIFNQFWWQVPTNCFTWELFSFSLFSFQQIIIAAILGDGFN